MATVHMSEAEVARDLHAVLTQVQQGVEVVIEQEHRAVAVICSTSGKGRLLSECIALAEARGTTAVPDESFMKDVEEGIAERSQPWKPPSCVGECEIALSAISVAELAHGVHRATRRNGERYDGNSWMI